jgi:hypothetical protein
MYRASSVIAGLLGGALWGASAAAQQDDGPAPPETVLEQYLADRGLNELLAAHLVERLKTEASDCEVRRVEVAGQPLGRNEIVHPALHCLAQDSGTANSLLGGAAMNPKHLGQTSALPASPEAAELDYVPNPRAGSLYLVRFAAPESTSLCAVTGQPDFAHLVIVYAPG